MREFEAPCTVYVASDFAQRYRRVWWIALEAVIAKAFLSKSDRWHRDAPRYLYGRLQNE